MSSRRVETELNNQGQRRRIEYVVLGEIRGAERNPKRHNAAGIEKSIERFGVAELPLLDERTGRLVAGHGRINQLRAMREAGQAPPEGVVADGAGDWLVPVTRGWASRSDADADAYLVGSNRLTEMGGWDNAELHALLVAVGKVDPELVAIAGYFDDDLAGLLDSMARTEVPPALTDPDDVPGVPSVAHSVLGDLWILGESRLLCGDSLNPEHLDAVLADLGKPGIVFTDPPYGISIVAGSKVGGGKPFGDGAGPVIEASDYLPVAGDGSPEVAADAFRLAMVSYPTARHIWWGGNHYAASAGLPDTSCWLVWDKENTGNFADAELAWTNHDGAVRLLRHMWNGMLRASERGKRVHPTQKPVALAEWAFEQVDPKRERQVVLDLFGGSGSTLIAAHRTGRRAAIVELEPHYVDTIARRWQEHVGQLPILAATGKPHDFTRAG